MDGTWRGFEKFTWTDENIEALKKLWAEGYSASQISARIGGTRNSVIGKVHRMGLASRVTHNRVSRTSATKLHAEAHRRRANRAARIERSRPPTDTQDMPPIVFEDGPGVALLDLEPHHCRWPLGELMRRSTEFCGHDHQPGSPYCAFHHHKAHDRSQAWVSQPKPLSRLQLLAIVRKAA